MACSTNTSNCNCKKVPCGCEQGINAAPPCATGAPSCPNPEPCAETFSDCCIIHNGDSFTYVQNLTAVPAQEAVDPGPIIDGPKVNTGFTILQGERLCDTWQRFISFYYCQNSISSNLEIPYGLKSKAITSTSITIGWTPTTSATSYDVYYTGASSGIFINAGNVLQNTNPSFTITGLSADKTYYVYVVANYTSGDFGETSCPSVSLILTTLSA